MNDKRFLSLLRNADSEATAPKPSDTVAERVRCRLKTRRARRARARYIAALAGCYAAGMLTMWLWAGRPPRDLAPRNLAPRNSPSAAVPKRGSAERRESPQRQITDPEAVATADRASPSAPRAWLPSSYELMRQLGEQHEQRGQVAEAVDCYSRALDAATDDELSVSPETDSWLLISLKRGRRPAVAADGDNQGDAI